MRDGDESGSMEAIYRETRFRMERTWHPGPGGFAILSACATTGEVWPDERNRAQDAALERCLRERGLEPHRITGYSPRTGHAEPGWGVALPLETARQVGRDFHQHAIYFVDDQDELWIVECATGRAPVPIGAFALRCDREGE